jgi:hypothetical protein
VSVRIDILYTNNRAAEALRTAGNPPPRGLEIWLDRQRFPLRSGPPKQSYYERRRAELVAKKARVTAIMEIRRKGFDKERRRWLKYHGYIAPGKESKKPSPAARVEAREVRVDKAREVRVAELLRLRNGGSRRK